MMAVISEKERGAPEVGAAKANARAATARVAIFISLDGADKMVYSERMQTDCSSSEEVRQWG